MKVCCWFKKKENVTNLKTNQISFPNEKEQQIILIFRNEYHKKEWLDEINKIKAKSGKVVEDTDFVDLPEIDYCEEASLTRYTWRF